MQLLAKLSNLKYDSNRTHFYCRVHNLKYKAELNNNKTLFKQCPLCEKEAKEIQQKEIQQKEQAKNTIDYYKLIATNIPQRALYELANIDFKKGAMSRFSDIYENTLLNGKCAFITGSIGLGKTLLLANIARHLCLKENKSVWYSELGRLESDFGANFKQLSYFDTFKKYEFLLIDECDEIKNADFINEILKYVYSTNKKVVICGNISSKDFSKILTPKVKDRANVLFKKFVITGESLRRDNNGLRNTI